MTAAARFSPCWRPCSRWHRSPCVQHRARSQRSFSGYWIVHSFGREFAPYDAIVSTFRTALAQGSRRSIAVFDESLDAGQAAAPDDSQPF